MPEVTMPRLSDTMQEGTIGRWLKKPGDEVKRGDILAEIETDKATMDLQAYDAGILEQILVGEGETVPIGQPVAIIGSGEGARKPEQREAAKAGAKDGRAVAGAAVAAGERPGTAAGAPTAQVSAAEARRGAEAAPAAPPAMGVPAGIEEGARIKASPLARRMAAEHGLDLRQIQGRGPGGRIERADIEDYLEQQRMAPAVAAPQPVAAPVEAPAPTPAAPAAPPEAEVIKPSRMQAAIARRMVEAKQAIPHIYVSTEIDVTDLLALRQTLNASAGEDEVKVSINDLVVKACALALEKFPEVNSSFQDGQFIRHKQINIGIAVDIPDGLVVPVIRDANLKGVRTIAREAKALVEKARARKLSQADLEGGTFSVSNLGMMDVTSFVAIINPPEAAILAVASVRKQFVPVDGQPVIRDIMPVTMSADHRILYGAGVARFLQEVKRLLQNPYSLLG
jgi:pyruvate dehydrogenase E2 component (dihydrolipoamide acetyltransferase)